MPSALTLQKFIVYRPAFSCRLPNEAVLRKVRPSCPVFLMDFHPWPRTALVSSWTSPAGYGRSISLSIQMATSTAVFATSTAGSAKLWTRPCARCTGPERRCLWIGPVIRRFFYGAYFSPSWSVRDNAQVLLLRGYFLLFGTTGAIVHRS